MNLITNPWSGAGCQMYGGTIKDTTGSTVSTPTDVPTLWCIFAVLQNIVNALLFFAGFVALFFILYSGIKYLLAAGNPEKIDSAKKTLTYAIIGLIVVILSFAFVNILSYILNVNLTQVTTQ